MVDAYPPLYLNLIVKYESELKGGSNIKISLSFLQTEKQQILFPFLLLRKKESPLGQVLYLKNCLSFLKTRNK